LEATLNVLNWPWEFLFKWTVPNCNFEDEGEELEKKLEEAGKSKEEIEAEIAVAKVKRERLYPVAFFMSIIWIGSISLLMVNLANWLGCLIIITPIIMGVTVLAAGTSIPDALGSIIAARAGMGDMAVSNAIGSNVFDILLGLGIPYFLYDLMHWGDWYCVDTTGILTHMFILFATVIATVGIFMLTKWKLNKTLGWVMLSLYTIFLIYSIVAGIFLEKEVIGCQAKTSEGTTGLGLVHLGSAQFARNPSDPRLAEIYAEQVYSDVAGFRYDYDPFQTNGCRDICSNRFT